MILLGSATIVGAQVVIQPPTGFSGVQAVRLTNYTADVIILQNITGTGEGSQEYLMPFQTNVYKVDSVRTPPTATGKSLGVAFGSSSLLVEWSTEPTADFPGTYPSALTEAPVAPSNSTDGVVVMAANATGNIAAGSRLSTTFYNNGTGVVYWSTNSATVLGAGTSAQLASGAGVTISGGPKVFLKADATGASVSFFGA